MVKLTLEFRCWRSMHVGPCSLRSGISQQPRRVFVLSSGTPARGAVLKTAVCCVCSGGIELLFDKRKEVDVDVPCKGAGKTVRCSSQHDGIVAVGGYMSDPSSPWPSISRAVSDGKSALCNVSMTALIKAVVEQLLAFVSLPAASFQC